MQKLSDKTRTTLDMIKWRRFIFALAFAFTAMLLAGGQMLFAQGGQKGATSAAHPLQVHVSASHIQHSCTNAGIGCKDGDLYASGTINGKKLELMGPARIANKDPGVLLPGDYPARIVSNTSVAGGAVVRQEYELVFPDGTTWRALVTGITE